jgi:hypothetical protein
MQGMNGGVKGFVKTVTAKIVNPDTSVAAFKAAVQPKKFEANPVCRVDCEILPQRKKLILDDEDFV